MRLPFNVLFLGWWFAGQSRTSDAQGLPKPFISVSPSQVVVLGGNVSIHCKTEQYPQMEFYLVKKEQHAFTDCKKAESFEAIFPILNAKTEDAGIYFCQYISPTEPNPWSDYSDEIYINITDSTFAKPSIKMQREPAVGMAFTIECQGPKRDLNFSLHKFSNLTAIEIVQPDRYKAHFTFHKLRLEDAGSYTCQYHHRRMPFVWSMPSDPLELNLIDSTLAKPSIKLQREPAVGMAFTIECQGPKRDLNFSLHKFSNLTAIEMVQPDRYKAHFIFHKLRLEDAGSYTCQYHHRRIPFVWSRPSDTLELNLIDPNLKKPTTILQGEPALGKNVTIECQGPERGLIFSLHKSRNLTSVQMVEPEGDTASFPFHMLSLKDAGKYTCQYHYKKKPFLWSEPSDPVELVLQDWTTIWTVCGAGLFLLLLLVLLAFFLYRRRKRVSAAEKRTQPLSEEAINRIPEAEAGEDTDEVSYAVLDHQPMRTKQRASPDTALESCLYASVAKDRARKGQ